MTPRADAVSSPGRAAFASRLLIVAVAVLGVGVAGAVAGVIAPALFVPATWIIGLGLLGAAAAGLLGTFGGRAGGS